MGGLGALAEIMAYPSSIEPSVEEDDEAGTASVGGGPRGQKVAPVLATGRKETARHGPARAAAIRPQLQLGSSSLVTVFSALPRQAGRQ